MVINRTPLKQHSVRLESSEVVRILRPFSSRESEIESLLVKAVVEKVLLPVKCFHLCHASFGHENMQGVNLYA